MLGAIPTSSCTACLVIGTTGVSLALALQDVIRSKMFGKLRSRLLGWSGSDSS